MPLHEYKCSACGRLFEELVPAEEKITCPGCGSTMVERQLSAPGRVGLPSKGGGLQCGKHTTCCGAAEPCAKPGCHE